MAPLKSGASFGTLATVFRDWLRCIVPPPVSNAKEEVSSSFPLSSSSEPPSSSSKIALTFQVSLLMRSITSTESRSMPSTVCDAAFARAAERAASSFSASKTK